MPVKIRLMRIGAKKRPFYRIVAIDERNKRAGRYLELIGTYNPLTDPKEIIIKKDLLEKWIKLGAVLSDGYLRITKQAPQRPPRKSKKERAEKPKPQSEANLPVEEVKPEETKPSEEAKPETSPSVEEAKPQTEEEPTKA